MSGYSRTAGMAPSRTRLRARGTQSRHRGYGPYHPWCDASFVSRGGSRITDRPHFRLRTPLNRIAACGTGCRQAHSPRRISSSSALTLSSRAQWISCPTPSTRWQPRRLGSACGEAKTGAWLAPPFTWRAVCLPRRRVTEARVYRPAMAGCNGYSGRIRSIGLVDACPVLTEDRIAASHGFGYGQPSLATRLRHREPLWHHSRAARGRRRSSLQSLALSVDSPSADLDRARASTRPRQCSGTPSSRVCIQFFGKHRRGSPSLSRSEVEHD